MILILIAITSIKTIHIGTENLIFQIFGMLMYGVELLIKLQFIFLLKSD